MKTILATASGGPSTLSFTRSLRDADPHFKKYRLIGIDSDKFNIHRSECEKTYICPKATDPNYILFLKEIIKRESVDFLHSQPEIEVYTIGKNRNEIMASGCKLLMPDQSIIELFRDKAKSYQLWKDAGIKVPHNILLNNVQDLKNAYDVFGENIWIRDTVGAAGKGSLSRPTYETALSQLNEHNTWGKALAAEHLTAKTVTWQSIWFDGKLVVAQGRERLNWAFGNRSQSGVTGLTGIGMTYRDSSLDNLAKKCIEASKAKPHGIYSVDFTYDQQGVPNPTEINIGKFFTTHHLVTKTGCNMPAVLVDLAFSEYRGDFNILNPCKSDMYWIRGIDIIPVLKTREEIDQKEMEYKEIISKLK